MAAPAGPIGLPTTAGILAHWFSHSTGLSLARWGLGILEAR